MQNQKQIMFWLKVIFALIAAGQIFTAITGYESYQASNVAEQKNWVDRINSLLLSGIALYVLYGLHNKLALTHKIVGLLIYLASIMFIFDVVENRIANDPAMTFENFWVPNLSAAIGALVVALGWKYIWDKQKNYFNHS